MNDSSSDMSPGRIIVPVADRERPINRLRIVVRDIGSLQILLAGGMLVSLLVSLMYRETYTALSFLVATLLTGGAGAIAYRSCQGAEEPMPRHAMIIAGAGWLVSAVFGAFPFLLAGLLTPDGVAQALVPTGKNYVSSLIYFRNPLHALFESMSTYTTTGLTMAVHEPSIGHGLLFYRSLGQWIGGAGVIVLSLAIIPRPAGIGSLELYQSETSAFRIRPSILGTARAIWRTYAIVTLLVACYLFIVTLIFVPDYGMRSSLFDAVNHAMCGQSTGGFSTLDDSIAGYRSYAMDIAYLLPMILGATAIPVFYISYQSRSILAFWRDLQFRSMILLLAMLAPAVAIALGHAPAVSDPLREGLFQVISAVSTTGWQTSDVGAWPASATMLLIWGGMVVGGAAGATVGGIKLVRAYTLIRAAGWRIRRLLLPGGAILPLRFGGQTLSPGEMQADVANTAVFTFLYLVGLLLGTIITAHQMGPGFTLADAMFESASAQGTVGLSCGITDPSMPKSIEVVFILQMWIGRLEIIPIMVMCGTLVSRMRRR